MKQLVKYNKIDTFNLKSIFGLLFLVIVELNLFAQNNLIKSDWEIFLEDSLILSGNLNTNYASRPTIEVDIDNGAVLKKIKIFYKGGNPSRSIVVFKEKDSVLFRGIGFSNNIFISGSYYSEKLKGLKGKTVEVFYSDNKLQTTPTLLGTLIVKRD